MYMRVEVTVIAVRNIGNYACSKLYCVFYIQHCEVNLEHLETQSCIKCLGF